MSRDHRRQTKFFICYRRDDEPSYARWIQDIFAARYEDVFMDTEGIPAGAEFRPAIQQKIEDCDVVVVLIGPKWVETMQKLAIEELDYVRMEIALALKLQKVVVPVCFAGAAEPKASEIHWQVRPMLNERHARTLNHKTGDSKEIKGLIDSIEQTIANEEALITRARLKKEAEELDKIRPASGLALVYFVNFVSEVVHRIDQLQTNGAEHLNLIEVTERGGKAPIHSFGLERSAREKLRLHIVIPPRVAMLERHRLEPVSTSLKQAVIQSAGSARPFFVDAWPTNEGYQFIDFPKPLTVVNNWIQRRLEQKRPDPDSQSWKELEDGELKHFQLMLEWWLADPNNDPKLK